MVVFGTGFRPSAISRQILDCVRNGGTLRLLSFRGDAEFCWSGNCGQRLIEVAGECVCQMGRDDDRIGTLSRAFH
jgi:hypothetical protein